MDRAPSWREPEGKARPDGGGGVHCIWDAPHFTLVESRAPKSQGLNVAQKAGTYILGAETTSIKPQWRWETQADPTQREKLLLTWPQEPNTSWKFRFGLVVGAEQREQSLSGSKNVFCQQVQ